MHKYAAPSAEELRRFHRCVSSAAHKAKHLFFSLYNLSSRDMPQKAGILAELPDFFGDVTSYSDIFGCIAGAEDGLDVFSPAAYFADLMRIIETYITSEFDIPSGRRLLPVTGDQDSSLEKIYSRLPFLHDLLNMRHIIQRPQSLDDLAVLLVFPQFLLCYRKRDGIHAQTRMHISRIQLDIIDFQPQTPYRRDKILQVSHIFQLQMHFKVIGQIDQIFLQNRQHSKADQQCGKTARGDGIEAASGCQPDDCAGPERDGGGQALNLVSGTVQKRISADDRDANQGGGGEDWAGSGARKAQAVLIQKHGIDEAVDTKIKVRSPALWRFLARSQPMTAANKKAIAMRSKIEYAFNSQTHSPSRDAMGSTYGIRFIRGSSYL